MTDPIVTEKSYYHLLPMVNKIVLTIRKHFGYEKGNSVDTVQTLVISLYDKTGKITEHNLPSKFDKTS